MSEKSTRIIKGDDHMDTRQRKRARGALHRTTLRFPERTFEEIREVCDELNITIAQYFNTLISSEEQKLLRRKIKQMERRDYAIEVPEELQPLIVDLTKALNENSKQMRKIGTNVSTIIRDICFTKLINGLWREKQPECVFHRGRMPGKLCTACVKTSGAIPKLCMSGGIFKEFVRSRSLPA